MLMCSVFHWYFHSNSSLSLPIQAADLRGVAEYEKIDPKGLFTLGSVIVDYRGYRVVCQTIIPGEQLTRSEGERERMICSWYHC